MKVPETFRGLERDETTPPIAWRSFKACNSDIEETSEGRCWSIDVSFIRITTPKEYSLIITSIASVFVYIGIIGILWSSSASFFGRTHYWNSSLTTTRTQIWIAYTACKKDLLFNLFSIFQFIFWVNMKRFIGGCEGCGRWRYSNCLC